MPSIIVESYNPDYSELIQIFSDDWSQIISVDSDMSLRVDQLGAPVILSINVIRTSRAWLPYYFQVNFDVRFQNEEYRHPYQLFDLTRGTENLHEVRPLILSTKERFERYYPNIYTTIKGFKL